MSSTTYTLQPLNYVNENVFTFEPNWEILHGAPCKLHFQLVLVDALGARRYLPPAGTLVSVSFLRSRPPTIGSNSVSISKNAIQILPNSDRSIYQIDLTSADTVQIISGGAKLSLNLGGVEVGFNLPHMVKKIVSLPGF